YLPEIIFQHDFFIYVIFLPRPDNHDDIIYHLRILTSLQCIVNQRMKVQLNILFLYGSAHASPLACRQHDSGTVLFLHLSVSHLPSTFLPASDSEPHSDPSRSLRRSYIHSKPPRQSLPHYLYNKPATDNKIS